MGREDRMAEEDETREEAVKVPVSAGPCSLLAWPLGNLTSLITGVPNLPANTQFRPPPVQAHPQAAPQELQHDRLLWHQLPPDREHHLFVRGLPRRALRSPPCCLRRPHG